MINERSAFFTIGEFAKIHGINKKTLMWYDEINLLKPAYVKENGYRYYTYHQSSLLETILMLRELNVSIKEIQSFMDNKSAEKLERLLNEKLTELNETINHLKNVKNLLIKRQNEMKTLIDIDLNKISIIEREQQYLVTVKIDNSLPFDNAIKNVIEETQKYQFRRLHDASYGSITPVEYLIKDNFSENTSLFIEIENPTHKNGLRIKPKGKYIQAFYKGDLKHINKRYKDIYTFAMQNKFKLYGHVYEKGINEIVIENFDEYITQIEIPIKNWRYYE